MPKFITEELIMVIIQAASLLLAFGALFFFAFSTGYWRGTTSYDLSVLRRDTSDIKDKVSELISTVNTGLYTLKSDVSELKGNVSELRSSVNTGLSKLKSDTSILKGNVSELKASVDARLSNLEQAMLLHRNASELGKSLPGATKPASATDKVPPRTRTP